MRFSATEVAMATDGVLHGPDVDIDGVTIDSRAVRPGQLFVPIVAERDGHDFVRAALAAGAAASLTHASVGDGGTWIAVADTAAALLDVGRLARRRLGTTMVVGITGSVGKTSVKDLTSSVLARRWRTAASEKSFNNELGVPLTLANAPDDTQAAVVEMGARGRGHIRLLCDVARPTIGVVTAVAPVHVELFGSVEEVAEAKSELVQDLPSAGTAVLNADDERVAAMARRTPARVLTYSSARTDADVVAVRVELDGELRPRFTLATPSGSVDVALRVRGAHQASNAVAAAATALACGVSLAEIAAGLADAQLSPWRMDLRRAPSGAWVLNDAYNANPSSMEAALRSLAALDADRRIAVLGSMAELGADAPAAHRGIADLAAELGIDLLAVGTDLYGVEPVDDPLGALASIGDGDAILVKASRVAGLEQLAAQLLD